MASLTLRRGDALLVVDAQQDLLFGGAMPVPDGDAVVEPLNRYIAQFAHHHLPVFATRDWHPEDHGSFVGNGGRWPPHCIADTAGAEFPAGLTYPEETQTVSKGTFRFEEGISAFDDTNLANRLRMVGCSRVFIGGLALDACVRATAIDALRLGFEVIVLQDAVRAFDRHPGDGARALGDILSLGGKLASPGDIVLSSAAA